MKLVITGASGYVAGRMLEALRERYDVTLLDVKTTNREGQEVEGIVVTDLMDEDRDRYREHFRGADAVLHCGFVRSDTPDRRFFAEHDNVKMIELKLSQGAKPGKGGILPGEKVTEEIAEIRGIPVGSDSISPNRHPEINSAVDLLDAINHIHDVSGLPTGFKSVIGAYGWLEELFAEIQKRGIESAPDFITVDSADGGTGAAPMSLIDYMGLPIRESLPLVVDILEDNGLRERIKIVASGKLITPADVAWALCVGAHFVVSARGFMFALGCIQALQCNQNTCPTGITTHNKRLQKGLDPVVKAQRVKNYVENMVYEVGVIAHSCGVREPRQLRRFHARVVTESGCSIALDDLYGEPAAVNRLVAGGRG